MRMFRLRAGRKGTPMKGKGLLLAKKNELVRDK